MIGILPTWVKSELKSVHIFTFVGVIFDLVEAFVCPSDAHIFSFFGEQSTTVMCFPRGTGTSRISDHIKHVIQMIQETTPVAFVSSLGWLRVGHSSFSWALVWECQTDDQGLYTDALLDSCGCIY